VHGGLVDVTTTKQDTNTVQTATNTHMCIALYLKNMRNSTNNVFKYYIYKDMNNINK